MKKPHLFKKDYGEYSENPPKKFGFLIRPTLQEYNDFILLFDKLLSDNINKKFFENDISLEFEQKRKDGKIHVIEKNTLNLLDEWIRKRFISQNYDLWDKSINSLRKVRKQRQNPAHSIDEDIFDQIYFKKQREILIEGYSAIRTIRLIFANHPNVKSSNIKIPDWLFQGKIWNF